MIARLWFIGASLLACASATCAEETSGYRVIAATDCPQDAVVAHVREQFATYGPHSEDREYFGFIYRFKGEIGSAVTRGHACANDYSCSVTTVFAASRIPKGAKVLGEWHTHPHRSSARMLSPEDVRGAQSNRHIRCYSAYYSQPDGDIYAWNPDQTSVPTAMNSAVLIGNYRRSAVPDSAAIIAAPENPGTQCLSTNTNVQTAATTKKCCRKSPTSRSPSAPAAARRDCAS